MTQFGVYRIRPRPTTARGNNTRKLTEVDVAEILTSSETNVALGKRFGVGNQQISRIRSGLNYGTVRSTVGSIRFNELLPAVKKTAQRWRRYGNQICDIDDITQEAMISAFRAACGIRTRKHSSESALSYMCNSAANGSRRAIVAANRLTNPAVGDGTRINRSAFVSTAVHDEALCGPGTATVESCLESAPVGDLDAAIDIMAAVGKLPPKLASVIRRRYLDGTDQDQADLAQTDGVSRAYIGQLEQKAMARLRRLLG